MRSRQTILPTKASWIFLPVLILFLSHSLFAQDLYSSTNIYIDNAAFIHVNGNVKNDGLIINNGSISLRGNWSNNFVYQGSGKIILAGSDQQFVNKAQTVQDVEVIGGGVKLFIGNQPISGNLNLISGTLKIQQPSFLMLTETAQISGGSDASYIDGLIRTKGNGYKYFPLGFDSKFYPIELIDVKGINPVLEVSVQPDYPFVVTPNIRKNVYWLRKTVEGAYDGSQISIAFDSEEFPGSEKIGIAQGESINKPIAIETDEFDVEFGSMNKVTSRRELKGGVFMLGEGPFLPPKGFYISTALAPSATLSENKTVRVFGEALTESSFTFKVFNRNGKILFETNSLPTMQQTGWDGRDGMTGNYLPAGSYPYILQGLQVGGKKLVKQGVITIVH
jgi:hypothetical protein